MSHPIKPTDAAIAGYHAALKIFADHSADHEGATETAFSQLLIVTGKAHGWTLIPKKWLKVGGKQRFPDGTFLDGAVFSPKDWEFSAHGAAKRRPG